MHFSLAKAPLWLHGAVGSLNNAMQSLNAFPERGRPSGRPNIRELIVPFGKAGYVLRYAHRPEGDELIVLRIWHDREVRD